MSPREQAEAMRRAGESYGRIASTIGVSRTTVYRWLNDEYAERERAVCRANKESYRGTCDVCGGPTNGSNGPGSAAHLCGTCSYARQRDNRYWTAERIIASIRAWADQRGRAPSARESLGDEDLPSMSSVNREFGSWNTAIEAAGLRPVPIGRYRDPRPADRLTDDERGEIVRRYAGGEASTRIARAFGIHTHTVLVYVRSAGHQVRQPSDTKRLAVRAAA